MLFRFSLYGFLKNQKYFEPLFYLILLNEKGLSFTMLGLLVGFGSACVNIMEIPSGAVADLYGRRRSMIFSFLSYIAGFVMFALAEHTAWLFAAMFLYSTGDAFRTGTHKAIIFDWLRSTGRANEKTRYYGITRSWSKTGSAVSAVIGVSFMLARHSFGGGARYSDVFFLCVIPYLAGIINFLGYPRDLDRKKTGASLKELALHLCGTFRDVFRVRELRGLFTESMSFEGIFETIKDYIQPVAYQMVLASSVFFAVRDKDQQTVFLVYSIYFVLNLLAVFASRYSHVFSRRMGGEDRACRSIWLMSLAVFFLLTIFLYSGMLALAIIIFIILHVMHNIWRPMQISRFDACSRPETGATILSIESQAKSLFTIIAAPLLGMAVDFINRGEAVKNFWPAGMLGLVVAAAILMRRNRACGAEK